MAPAQQSRVLRCCSCHIFQAHQVKKSLKWTCKACGEKQSFVRAYGEGSGADCRRHVQKLNLLQGQVSELSLRSVEEAVNASEEENAGPQQAEAGSQQALSKPLESRWLKYLDKGFEDQELDRGRPALKTQLSASAEWPSLPCSPAQPRKRKRNQSTGQPTHSLHVQSVDSADNSFEHQDSTDLYGTEQQGISPALSTVNHIRELGFPRWKLPSPVMQVNAPSSKWARFLLSPGSSPQVDEKPPSPLQEGTRLADPAQVEQGTVETKTPVGHFSRAPDTIKPPQTTHTTVPQLDRPDRKTPEQPRAAGTPQADGRPLAQGAQKAPPLQLHNLFTTGEDFDDDL
ncbi:MRN complex-interacting protein [Grammomys surdaster]|uniref:MRN complex-interacting protein n=1 Tax=Grammomys surdaster TaxID=491861 RepID=UPI0010A0BB6C|nr:MRN complex-interacting protein [Grammomys surdaster]